MYAWPWSRLFVMEYIIELTDIVGVVYCPFNMNLIFVIMLAFFFSVQLCLTCILLFIDFRAYLNLTGDFRGRDYHWERALVILLGVLQTSLLIVGLAGIIGTLRSGLDMCGWIEFGIMCSLQLGIGTSLARLLQVCQYPRWQVRLTCVVAFAIMSDDIPMSFTVKTYSVDKQPVLTSLAIASLLCATVSYSGWKSHKSSGLRQPNKTISRLFISLIITNVLAAAVQLSGGIFLAISAFVEVRLRIQVRQSVLLACTCTHVLCCLPACSASIMGCFTRLEASLRNESSSTAIESNVENGFMTLGSRQTSQGSSNSMDG